MAKDLYLSEGRVMGPDGQLDLATAFPNDPVVNATSLAPVDTRRSWTDMAAVSDMQAGHGWTGSGAGDGWVWNLDDTADFAVGSQCISGVSNGAGTARYIRKTGLTVNLADNDLLVWVKVSGLANLLSIGATLASGTFTNMRTLNIFDGTTSDATVNVGLLRDGEWFPLRVPTTRSAADGGTLDLATVTELQFTVDDRANGNAVTVKFGGVYLVPHLPAFPNGVVSVSFDDCYTSDYASARPIMARRGMSGTIYAIPERMNGTDGPTVAQYREMQDLYGWDIQAHGLSSLANMTAAEAEADVASTKRLLRSYGFGSVDHYAYPQGGHDADSDGAVRNHFATARTTAVNTFESMRPAHPLRLRALLVQSNVTTATVQGYIDATYDRPCWLHLVFHRLAASGATGADYNVADFTTIIDYLHTKGIPVLPVADVWRSITAA